ncbi:MAG: ABC transporter ATP-binding protein [Actinobacteria bacterium]|nr:ABC transporter ATP-binding protein [Actinomycetota bacterium]
MSIVSTRELTKVYRVGELTINAVNGLDLEIEKGEFVSIMGPSGSGKTTLLNLLGCLDVPTSGTVAIDGMETGRLSSTALADIRREKVGFIFQEFNLLPILNAAENVELPLRYLKVHKSERRRRALAALEKVGLTDRAANRPSQLSGGEQQRVAIARALVTEPALVLADEPTGELDTENTVKLMDLASQLNHDFDQTFAIVTHDPMVAGRTNRIISIRDGRIESDEPADNQK